MAETCPAQCLCRSEKVTDCLNMTCEVVVQLPQLRGRTLVAQARGVLGSTPGDCRPFFTFFYFRLITSKFLYFQCEVRCSEYDAVAVHTRNTRQPRKHFHINASPVRELSLITKVHRCLKIKKAVHDAEIINFKTPKHDWNFLKVQWKRKQDCSQVVHALQVNKVKWPLSIRRTCVTHDSALVSARLL